MGILSRNDIRSFRNTTDWERRSITESLKNFSKENKYGKITIFLSHKHDELEELDGAIQFLKSFGVEVYVDWDDDKMPEKTSGITAARIKGKIKDCHKFILLASEGAIGSKWCNWELGHGDAEKYINHIALLPLRNSFSNEYRGSEYLQIYPYIYESNTSKGIYFVKYPDGSLISLNEWLNS